MNDSRPKSDTVWIVVGLAIIALVCLCAAVMAGFLFFGVSFPFAFR